jgi:hypothetical protein
LAARLAAAPRAASAPGAALRADNCACGARRGVVLQKR